MEPGVCSILSSAVWGEGQHPQLGTALRNGQSGLVRSCALCAPLSKKALYFLLCSFLQ